MKTNLKRFSSVLCTALMATSSLAYAGVSAVQKPTDLTFNNDQTLEVNLSDTNVNRIVVQGDEITQAVCPEGYCTATHNQGDTSGAVYLSVIGQMPFTVFFETKGGRHFGLTVTPQNLSGQTLVLTPIGGSVVAGSWEKNSDYRAILEELMRDMMLGKIPEGYGYSSLSDADSFWFRKLALIKPVGLWTGDHIMGVQYQITNDSDQPLTIPESAFYHNGVRAVALVDQTIAP